MLKIGFYAGNNERGLNENISKFWDLDAVGIKDNEISIHEKFKDGIKFENNRYSVKLPVKEFHPILPDNYLLSLKRLNKLKERLDGNRELLKHYDDIFQEQLQTGIIEEVHDEGECGNVTYLPHREVVKDQSVTTKVRIVFDASARLKGQLCLNDILYKGPCLNPELYNLLLQFRVYPIAITGDIEKAYLQISVDEKDKRFITIFMAQEFI